MHNLILLGLVFSIFFSILPSSFSDENYVVEVDDHAFEIIYDVDADVLAMVIDKEQTSLLVGIENSQDSLFSINFSNKMLNAENAEFAVLVNGLEVDYSLSKNSDDYALRFFIPSGTEEIEIIGTYVIPEFSYGALFGFVLINSLALILTKSKIFKS